MLTHGFLFRKQRVKTSPVVRMSNALDSLLVSDMPVEYL